MKALSVQQPYAHCIIYEGKDWENRTWRTSYRGPLLIQVGKKIDVPAWEALRDECGIYLPPIDQMQTGGIIGMVDLIDCVHVVDHPEIDSMWISGPFAFKLANPKPLKFVPLPGKLGLFDVDDSLVTAAAL